jgi:hypothetical protein
MHAPAVLGVGDLHLNNFGTWRDAEGGLVWGVNDFDEAVRLPYTADLVRLATSVLLAANDADAGDVCRAILSGYEDGTIAGGAPLVLAPRHVVLRKIAAQQVKRSRDFWGKLRDLPDVTGDVPAQVLRLLPRDRVRIVHRLSGLGSMGRRRYLALTDETRGREVKEVAPSAWIWANGGRESVAISRLLKIAFRSGDPHLRATSRWVVRPVGPDIARIELDDMPQGADFWKLLAAMGWETANIHMGSGKRGQILADSALRKGIWLEEGALAMAHAVTADWKELRRGKDLAAGAGGP